MGRPMAINDSIYGIFYCVSFTETVTFVKLSFSLGDIVAIPLLTQV